MDPRSSMMNTLYNVLNGEVTPPFQFAGPFYNQVRFIVKSASSS